MEGKATPSGTRPWLINIDTGGTFTDCLAQSPDGDTHRLKVLSSGVLRGRIRQWQTPTRLHVDVQWPTQADLFVGYHFRLLSQNGSTVPVVSYDAATRLLSLQSPWPGERLTDEFEISAGEEAPVLAARLLTGTSLEGTFPPIELRLGSTRGTNALLERKGARVALLLTAGLEDLLLIGDQTRPDLFALHVQKPEPLYHLALPVAERLDAQGQVLTPLSEAEIQRLVQAVHDSGCDSVAIALLHAYRNPQHEQQLAQALRQAGLRYVTASHQMAATAKLLPRAETSVVNAYLAPIIEQYLDGIRQALDQARLRVMSSAGGLMGRQTFQPKDSLLSGPAGGVVGAATLAEQCSYPQILTLDMGGTSSDVARYQQGYDYRYETQVGPARVLSPSVAVETVAAGGGSICRYDGHKLTVGPDSAGAQPGPACYGAGGPLTLTDVNLLLDRLDPSQVGIPLNREAAQAALRAELTGSGLSPEAALQGWLRIANETMAQAIRTISVGRGYAAEEHALLAFGGAGGMHVCAVARLLGIREALVPRDAGILSAVGLSQASLERFATRQVLQPWEEAHPAVETQLAELARQATEALAQEGLAQGDIEVQQRLLYLRFQGQDHSLEVEWQATEEPLAAFETAYRQLFGHWMEDRAIELVSLKVIARQRVASPPSVAADEGDAAPDPTHWRGPHPVYPWAGLPPGARLRGPAILAGPHSTTFIEEGWGGQLDAEGNLRLAQEQTQAATQDDPAAAAVRLELFTRRFQAVAEEMGALLQRTSFSVNVKERLDFSCALLDADGELVVNAPHIPVHLGSLGVCTRAVRDALPLQPGDVAITNHPGYGGSHLPDVTLIAPVHTAEGRLIGYLANRAHHAEIGGKRPGSMPPDAQNLAEEGVVIAPQILARQGEVDWAAMERLFTGGPYPSRNLAENFADLNAALASIRAGEKALLALVKAQGADTVQGYMQRLKRYAAERLQARLEQWPQRTAEATEYLDDGHPLRVQSRIEGGRIHLDFSGSGAVHPGNFNANEAIVRSVVLYVLRLLLQEDIPLNEGLMKQVQLHLPTGMLNPAFPPEPEQCPAVVGGNVETSQRLVDTLLKALGLMACSQGTMNNLLFGDGSMGYYETIGGGTGAGPDFPGASGVHHHMTNTRITDPEILELRYPVRLEHFGLRQGSGGKGKHCGGDGIRRKIKFLRPVELTLLTQHRSQAPYGLAGGQPGAKGQQWLYRLDGQQENLPGMVKRRLEAGEAVEIETPGGGGYGITV